MRRKRERIRKGEEEAKWKRRRIWGKIRGRICGK